MTETNTGKVVNRNIAFALGLICIVLAAGLVVTVVNGDVFSGQSKSDLEDQVAAQATTISSLTAQVTILQNQLTTLNTTVSDYADQITDLTEENELYASILDFNESAVIWDNEPLTQDANTTTSIWSQTVNYAGYIEVQVQAASNTTYVQAAYTFEKVTYKQTFVVGTDGTAYFPILPSTIEVTLGNTDTAANNATVTLMYYY